MNDYRTRLTEDAKLAEDVRVRVFWGYGLGFRVEGVGTIVKMFRKSVRVRLEESVASPYGGAPWPAGHILNGIPRIHNDDWKANENGVELLADETTYQPIADATDPRVVDFLDAWHENGRDDFERSYANLDYDGDHYHKHATDRRKYVCLDCGTSGVMMVEKATGEVYGIKGYGRIHRGHFLGMIEERTASYREATAANREIRCPVGLNLCR